MPFSLLWPYVAPLDGSTFRDAIKNFIHFNRNLQIQKLIVTDQNNHVEATLQEAANDTRNRGGMNVYPSMGIPQPPRIRATWNIAPPARLAALGLNPVIAGLRRPMGPALGVARPTVVTRGIPSATVLGRPGTHTIVNGRSHITPPGLPGALITSPVRRVITPTGPISGPREIGPTVGVAVAANPVAVLPRPIPLITNPSRTIAATATGVMATGNALGPLRVKKNAFNVFPRVIGGL